MNKGIFEGKLLVCDMDGTLLDGRQKVSEANLRAIEFFVEQGGLFTLATGRDEKSIINFMEQLPVNIPVILYNGAGLYDYNSQKILWSSWLPNSAPDVLSEIMETFPGVGAMVFKRSDIHFVRENHYTNLFVERDSIKPIYSRIDEISLPWTKVILAWDPENHKKLEEYLMSRNLPFRHVYSQPDFIELLNFEATKGRALKELSRITGIDKRNIISVGDNMNDLEMIQYAGTGIAVENANEGLKIFADICCCHHEDNAIAQVIDWISSGKIVCE